MFIILIVVSLLALGLASFIRSTWLPNLGIFSRAAIALVLSVVAAFVQLLLAGIMIPAADQLDPIIFANSMFGTIILLTVVTFITLKPRAQQ